MLYCLFCAELFIGGYQIQYWQYVDSFSMVPAVKDTEFIEVCWDVLLCYMVRSPRLLDFEDEGSMIYINVSNIYSPIDTGSHLSPSESLAIPL